MLRGSVGGVVYIQWESVWSHLRALEINKVHIANFELNNRLFLLMKFFGNIFGVPMQVCQSPKSSGYGPEC